MKTWDSLDKNGNKPLLLLEAGEAHITFLKFGNHHSFTIIHSGFMGTDSCCGNVAA